MSEKWENIANSAEDVPVNLAWQTADRLSMLFDAESPDVRRQVALKAASEFAYRAVGIGMTPAEPMARQLEAMAAYIRKNM